LARPIGSPHTYFAMGQYTRAADALVAALDAYPQLPQVQVNPRDFYDRPQQFAAQYQQFQEASGANPSDGQMQLLLAYLKLQQGRLLSARLTALSAKRLLSKQMATSADALLVGISERMHAALASGPKLGEPVMFSTAGAQVSLPTSFELQRLFDPNQVFNAIRGAAGTDKPQGMGLWVYPIDNSLTTGAALDQIIERARQNATVEDLTLVDHEELTLLGSPAVGRLYTCRLGGQEIVLVRLALSREVTRADGHKQRLLYVIGMGVLAGNMDDLLPTLGLVMSSMKLTDLAHPAMPVVDAGSQVEDPQMGVTFWQPAGWAIQPTDNGFEIGQADYLLGGRLSPRVRIIRVDSAEPLEARTVVEQAIQSRRQAGQEVKVISEGPAKLAGSEGYQVVLRRLPGSLQPGDASDAAEGAPAIEAGRVVCVNTGEGGTRFYAMVVQCATDDSAASQALLEDLSGRLQIIGTVARQTGAENP